MPIATPEELKAIWNELLKQSDRGAGIIAAAILEDFLTEALKKRLILNKTLSERLFSYEKNGPLSNFNAKISIGYSIGLFKVDMRSDLDAIRRIRNRFAHRVTPLTFDDPEISARCASLREPLARDVKDARDKYIQTSLYCTTFLFLIANIDIRIQRLGETPGLVEKFDALLDQIIPDGPDPSP